MKKRTYLALLAVACAMHSSAQTLPYQNPALEKATVMMDKSKAIPRLGIPEFAWWSEALHGVGRNGVSTVFPSCIGMAASFDDSLLERIYTAVSDEARAKNTVQRRTGRVATYQGLSFWTPNINIFRDPRRPIHELTHGPGRGERTARPGRRQVHEALRLCKALRRTQRAREDTPQLQHREPARTRPVGDLPAGVQGSGATWRSKRGDVRIPTD